jgi:hypothetical protein
MRKLCFVLLFVFVLSVTTACCEDIQTPHKWWNHDAKWVKKAFDEGVEQRVKGAELSTLGYRAQPYPYTTVGHSVEMISADFQTPMIQLLVIGWGMENRKATDTERERYIKGVYPSINQTIKFSIHLRSFDSLESLTATTCAAETDAGVKLKPLPPAIDPIISVGSTPSTVWYNYHHYPAFALTDDKGKLAVLPTTKYIKLWIIAPGGRVSVKYPIDDYKDLKVLKE